MNSSTSSSTAPRRHRRSSARRTTPVHRSRPVPQTEHRLTPVPHDAAPVGFESFGLHKGLLRGITDRGYVRTTPIQSASIPLMLQGSDLIACAQTGTGKTAAFLLPLMHRLLSAPHHAAHSGTRALILAPTRELAVQIEDDIQGLAYHTSLTAVAVYGGVAAGGQERALRAGVDIVVATPGRLLDHMNGGSARFTGIEILVLDEADRMLDMGFWPDVRRIVSAVPSDRQTLFFSATMSDDVFRSALQIMREPKLVQVGRAGGPATKITHESHEVAAADKTAWLARFLRHRREPTLIFVRTKRSADRLARRLSAAGICCAALHADRTQSQRTAAVMGFKSGRYTALVATDVAARGLDIDGIAHVINYEVPDSPDAYVHRVGRTGRAEATGVALTLTDRAEMSALRALERSLAIEIGNGNLATTIGRSNRSGAPNALTGVEAGLQPASTPDPARITA